MCPASNELAPAEFVAALRAGVAEELDPASVRLRWSGPFSLIGTAGVTLYEVGVVKQGLERASSPSTAE